MSKFAFATRRSIIAFSCATLIAAVAGADTVERTFDVRPGGKLILDTDLGSVDVRTTADNTVRVKVEREAGSGRDDDFVLAFDQRGDDVFVEGKRPGGGWGIWGFHNRFKVRFDIEVPEEYDIDIETAGGSISIADLEGDIDCNTSGGSIRVADIAGRVDCRTSGGSVHIGRVDGSVLAKSSGGSITIDRSGGSVVASTSGGSVTVNEVMGSIDASTSGGNVTAQISSQPSGDCRLSTSGGNIEITLAPEVAVDLDAKTSGGRIDIEMPMTLEGSVSKTSVRGAINGGGPELSLRTSGGNVYVKRH
jgi:Toastrack DUF4097